MNKSKTPTKRTKSPHHLSTSVKKSQLSKSPAKKQFLNDLNITQKLKNNRQKLTHTLDTYTMLIRSRNQIRCLEHNSIISIYCQTQNKLLCTNCVFGRNQHKFHRINPIDKCFGKIKENIQKMAIPVEKQITMINSIKDLVLNNLDSEMIQVETTLEQITVRYAQAHRALEQSFYEVKNKLLTAIQRIKFRNQTVALQLNFLKDIYDVKTLMLNAQLDMNEQNQLLLYRHSLLSTINAQKKFQGHLWTSPKNEIKVLGEVQIKKIAIVCQKLKQNNSSNKSIITL